MKKSEQFCIKILGKVQCSYLIYLLNKIYYLDSK